MTFNPQVFFYTSLALIAFAANSVLCRMALGANEIDAMSFTVTRLLSGSLMLVLLVAIFEPNKLRILFKIQRQVMSIEPKSNGLVSTSSVVASYCFALLGPLFLFVYAAGFSYAYITLDTGIGALILFAVVQITMIIVTIVQGYRLNLGECMGLLIGFSGFVYLLYPSLTGPSAYGLILMTISGLAWGGYSVLGQRKSLARSPTTLSPLVMTANNFILSLPFAFVLLIIMFEGSNYSLKGVFLSVLSGAVMSGLGYALWYKALQYLNTTRAAVSQLLVPVLASIGGLLLVNEAFTLHLLVSSVVVLGGILIVVVSRK